MSSWTIDGVKITAISDGIVSPSSDCVIGMDRAEATRRMGVPGQAAFDLPVNTFLIERDGRYGLIDAGTGTSFGPALGKQPENLRKAGVDPTQIAFIFLTHMHPDHSNGLVDGDGRAVYPNAEVLLHENEASFWLDRDVPPNSPDMVLNSQRNNRRSAAAYPGRFRRVHDGEVVNGFTPCLHAGHTPGHTAWLMQAGSEGVFFWGDTVHLPNIQLADPNAAMVFDIDPAGARASRRRAFDRAAADRLWIAGAHLDFPGVGHVTRKGTGWTFEPAD